MGSVGRSQGYERDLTMMREFNDNGIPPKKSTFLSSLIAILGVGYISKVIWSFL